MAQMILTLFDCAGIQSYIFAGNKLKENIGASELIERATHEAINDALTIHFGQAFASDWSKNPEYVAILHDTAIAAEIVYQGGGNAAILFRNRTDADDFLYRWSETVLREMPGINPVAVAMSCETSDKFDAALETAHRDLAALKRKRSAPRRLLGLSVSLECTSTGLAATHWKKTTRQRTGNQQTGKWMSAETFCKYRAVPLANNRLQSQFGSLLSGYEFPLDFDDLGGIEGENHLAVVHADGNGMGDRFRQVVEGKSFEAAIVALRRLSLSVAKAGKIALENVLLTLIHSKSELEKWGVAFKYSDTKEDEEDPAAPVAQTPKLPLRPLIYGGDDLTLVCDGRIGLAVATLYLEEFNKQVASDQTAPASKDKQLHACAGVAIVKAHFPFGRAYHLADECISNAKKEAKERKGKGKGSSSWIDFHIALSGVSNDLEDLRRREYRSEEILNGKTNSLLSRPYMVVPQIENGNDKLFAEFTGGVTHFRDNWARSKAKALRDALFAGEAATDNLIGAITSRGDTLPQTTGSKEPRRFFDMLETLDFYVPLGAAASEEEQP